jgi:hypothetical protein
MKTVNLSAQSRPLRLRAVGTVGFVLCFASASWHVHSSRELDSVVLQTSKLRASLDRPNSSATRGASEYSDLSLRLPERARAESVVRDLQRAAAAASVTFVSLSAADRLATAQTLGRLELRVTLRGSYAGAKSVLAEVMARQPAAVVQRLAMRQVAEIAELETQVDLLLLMRPLSVAPAGSSQNLGLRGNS